MPTLQQAITSSLVATVAAVAVFITPLSAQSAAKSNVPVRELAPTSAVSSESFANIFNVREVAGGKVLVNDALRRQVVLLDATLSHPTVVLDTTPGAPKNYGPLAEPLLRWLGDSSLFLDVASRTILVLDGAGKIARTMAAPKQSDLGRLWTSESGLDQNGNLLYRVGLMQSGDSSVTPAGAIVRKQRQSDSAMIVRANFETRTVDTIGRIKQDNTTETTRTEFLNGKQALNIRLNPLTPIDEWTALPDGTLAFIRGHDYHVDWLLADGTWKSTDKLPYDWKRLSDTDKQHLIDSTRSKIERLRVAAEDSAGKIAGEEAVLTFLRGAVATTTRPGPITAPATGPAKAGPELSYDFAPFNEIADYYPPIRIGAAKADPEGNLWILPTTSAQSKRGELVYDVVNHHGAPFYRVRMPVGRSIIGFGKGGALYLMNRDAAGAWHLERTTVSTTVTARD